MTSLAGALKNRGKHAVKWLLRYDDRNWLRIRQIEAFTTFLEAAIESRATRSRSPRAGTAIGGRCAPTTTRSIFRTSTSARTGRKSNIQSSSPTRCWSMCSALWRLPPTSTP